MNANKSGRYGRPLRAAVLALVLALGLTTMGGLAGAGRAGLGTTTALAAGTSTIWPDTATPVTTVDSDPNAVELGVKFRTDVDGYVTGVRFWKGTPNTGTHTGNLWTSTGTRLATAVFTTETSSGWQQVDFGAPVPVTAGTTYVASYHTTSGYYAADADFFATSGVDNPPLHALRDGVDGSNGVYSYSATSTFPTQSWRASNYWVDVVFTSTVAPDTTAPTVTSVVPADGATGVARTAPVSAVFSEAMDPATISTSTVTLVPTGGATPVAATVAYDAATRSLSLQPSASLAPVTGYTATIKGGASGVKDLAGNPLAQDRTWSFTTGSSGPCDTPANATVAENCLPGSPASEWDVSGAGDPSIQGFATDISVTRPQSGQTTTVSFKIDTTASAYRIDIYRLGYYGGQGARKVASITPTDVRKQSNCLTDATTGLIDCGNWRVSATWTVPSAATSGLYIARPVRSDTGGASHVPFVVRDDARTSDVLVQTSDTTWQAYNTYGGNSLYTGSPDGRAYKVSYNRPFVTRGVDGGQDWLFNAEYPMIRWLERNGYDVSYQSGIDTDRLGATPLGRHRTFLSVGHDEYWSGGQRANVESARGTGLNLAFFSGNEVFWKTRWETSIDGSGTAYRTLVCYKETHANAKIDPSPSWTGTWRDPRFSPPSDGGRPENALTGTIFMVNDGATTSIVVPEADGKMRFWRGTSIASLSPGSSATLPNGTLGYEWDSDLDNGSRPVGTVRLSSTTVPNAPVLQDYGSTYGSGTARHNLTLYRQQGGGLVFGAGTVQWTWGLDATHDRSGTPVSVPMQQATVNLLADMGAQPATIATGLSPATASTDQTPPTAAISSPAPGAVIAPGATMTVSGTASDVGGRVGGVEVSTDGGTSWHPATGRASWTYQWTAGSAGSVTIRARAADDSANLGSAASVTVSVGSTTTDTTAPKVVSVSPVSGATGVGVSSGVSAVFDEAIDPATVSSSTVFDLPRSSRTVGPLKMRVLLKVRPTCPCRVGDSLKNSKTSCAVR